MDEKEYLTQEKFDEFSKEVDFLKKVRRKEIAEDLEYAKSLGDLSENAEYHEARNAQANIEDRIVRLESILKSSVIISSHDTNAVAVGSVVTVIKEKDYQERTYTIVGTEEADMDAGKISIRSPFGAAIIGRKKNDRFTFNTPLGLVTYQVVKIK